MRLFCKIGPTDLVLPSSVEGLGFKPFIETVPKELQNILGSRVLCRDLYISAQSGTIKFDSSIGPSSALTPG